MKDPAITSPFAAKTSQEQLEQWNWWHSQQDATTPVPETEETSLAAQLRDPEPPLHSIEPPARPHHRQYDAVMKRMTQARKQTGAFTEIR